MINKVLILGIRRGGELIPDFEISQMVGRCGRSYSESGEATVIVPMRDEEEAIRYLHSKPSKTSSRLASIEDLSFHFLPSVVNLDSISEEDFSRWFSRSLGSLQGFSPDWRELKDFLIDCCCASEEEGELKATELGKISCRYYVTPAQASKMLYRIEHAGISGGLDEISLPWILAHSRMHGDLSEDLGFQDYLSNASGRGCVFEEDEIEAYSWHCLMTCRRPRALKAEMANLRKDADRMLEVVREIMGIAKVDMTSDLEDLGVCITRNLPRSLAKISKSFPDAKKQFLFELESLMIHNQASVDENWLKIERQATDELKDWLKLRALQRKEASKTQRAM